MKDYYEVLEVSRKASKDTINKVFKMHMKSNHPDLFQGDEKIKAEEKSKELTEAYNILSDDNERAKYDMELKESENLNSSGQMQTLIEENEYLKQMINKKDDIIARLTNPNPYGNDYDLNQYNQQYGGQYQNQYQNTGYVNNPYQNNYSNQYEQNPYENMTAEELKQLKREQTKQYYISMLKEFGIKLLILALILIALLWSLFSSVDNLTSLYR